MFNVYQNKNAGKVLKLTSKRDFIIKNNNQYLQLWWWAQCSTKAQFPITSFCGGLAVQRMDDKWKRWSSDISTAGKP